MRDNLVSLVKSIALAASLTMAMAGCQAMTGKTAGQNIDDATISASVKSQLVAERASNLTRVDVDTEKGTVYLTGSVPSEQAKNRAGALAGRVGGVKGVVNNLQVTEP